MSIQIIKPGIQDTVQDAGRFGYQYLGINPSGVMDEAAMKISNALVGNRLNEPVIEMHFPAAEVFFNSPALIALSGADFRAKINNITVPINQPIIVNKHSTLIFSTLIKGARVYLSVKGGFKIEQWLSSASTNIKAKAGGYKGRSLIKGDVIDLNVAGNGDLIGTTGKVLPWRAAVDNFYCTDCLRFIPGYEYDLMSKDSKDHLIKSKFFITNMSDRMGYRLEGPTLGLGKKVEIISTAVTKGTIQFLPNGQLIVLMADHQTTGGYPRIGHIISADLSSLAQKRSGENISFKKSDIATAEESLYQQHRNLLQLQNACNFRIQQYFNI